MTTHTYFFVYNSTHSVIRSFLSDGIYASQQNKERRTYTSHHYASIARKTCLNRTYFLIPGISRRIIYVLLLRACFEAFFILEHISPHISYFGTFERQELRGHFCTFHVLWGRRLSTAEHYIVYLVRTDSTKESVKVTTHIFPGTSAAASRCLHIRTCYSVQS